MFKKVLAVAALAIGAILLVPAAANASYVANDKVVVSGSTSPGGTAVVTFKDGSFTPGETVSFSVTGEGPITLSAVKAAVVTVTSTKVANATTGSVVLNVTLPANATGSYTVTATGLSFGNVGTAAITVRSADAGAGAKLPFTGANISPLIIWGAGGILLLGVALLIVLAVVRRQRAIA